MGWYEDRSQHQDGLLLSESDGLWSATEASLPADAATSPQVRLDSVSCASAGSCAAVGSYVDSSRHVQALLVSETAGKWGQGVEGRLPANATPSPEQGGALTLDSVSCPSPGNCIAVGTYVVGSDQLQGLLLTEQGGRWTNGVEAPLPAGVPTDAILAGELSSVSCASAGNCTAVGDFDNAKGHFEGLLLTEHAGQWTTGVEVNLPPNAATRRVAGAYPSSGLLSVSCTSAGNCLAAGAYLDHDGGSRGLLVIQRRGSWTIGMDEHLPTDRSLPDVVLRSASCGSPRTCAAVGSGLLVGPG